jgi:orotate phosphoribosyltransferase
LSSTGLTVSDVVVLIDRRAPGENELAQRGYALHSVLTLNKLLDYYEQAGSVPAEQILAVRRFLAATSNE